MAIHFGSQSFHHVDKDMVVADTQTAVFEHLNRRVPVADMPSNSGGMGGIFAMDIGDGLLGGMDLDEAAILQDESVAVGQQSCFYQVEEERLALVIGQADTAAVPFVEEQGHRADNPVLRPAALAV